MLCFGFLFDFVYRFYYPKGAKGENRLPKNNLLWYWAQKVSLSICINREPNFIAVTFYFTLMQFSITLKTAQVWHVVGYPSNKVKLTVSLLPVFELS